MLLGGAGLTDVNVLQSINGAFRNNDFVSNQGLAFAGGGIQAAVVAENAHVQLFNPVGSGVTILLDELIINAGSSVNMNWQYHNTELATLIGAWRSWKNGDPDGAGIIRRESNAGILGTNLMNPNLQSATTFVNVIRFPLIIEPGEGFLLANGATNSSCRVQFIGREV